MFNAEKLSDLLRDENQKKRITDLEITGCSENDLMISGFGNLDYLVFDGRKEDYKDVCSLTISNNPKLRTILFKGGSCYSTISVCLSSMMIYD